MERKDLGLDSSSGLGWSLGYDTCGSYRFSFYALTDQLVRLPPQLIWRPAHLGVENNEEV